MRRFFFFLFILQITLIFAQVSGELSQVDGKFIIKVWGTHYQRGYAQGYLLADNIKEVWTNYIFNTVFYHSAGAYNNAVNTVSQNFVIEQKYHDEANGMIDGMLEKLGSIYLPELGRNYNEDDILFCNSLVDYLAFTQRDLSGYGCSSMSGWDSATEQSELNGEIIITRLMDWQADTSLKNNPLLMVQFPNEENEVPWVSIGFPGLFGALSGFNINSLSAFMNMGNFNNQNNLTNLHPIWLSERNGLEMSDYNNDGQISNNDILDAVNDKNHAGPFIVHTTDTNSAYVIEVNNAMGCTYRTDADNTIIPDNLLVATNHFRKLYEPVSGYRYMAISDSLNNNSEINPQRSWQIMSSAAGTSYNLFAMQYIPSLHTFKWSSQDASSPAYLNPITFFDTEDIFQYSYSSPNQIAHSNGISYSIYPNPTRKNLNICFNEKNTNQSYFLTIYNLKGERVFSRKISGEKKFKIDLNYIDKNSDYLKSGFYFMKIGNGIQKKVKKFIYIK